MKKSRMGLVIGAIILVSGCTTSYMPTPVVDQSYQKAPSVNIVNGQVDTKPRMIFSDGITTRVSEYRGFTDRLILSLHEGLVERGIKPDEQKELSVSISSIACHGHYVTDCTVSALVEYGEEGKKVIDSAKRSGYPYDSALNKAMKDVTDKIIDDGDIGSYLTAGAQ